MTNYTEQALKAFLDSGGRLDQLLKQGAAQYFILSTDTKPATANVGDELYYVDTGDYFVYYADEWHLKIEGNYWYTDNGTFTSAFVFTTPITADITLYAKWV